jgi:glycosyltransferase involved in cell wall biosynthesis
MRISVVMPTLNEFANLAARARDLDAQPGPWEWIVADGGSSDGTADRAAALGARLVTSVLGRGLQLDTGTRVASGEIVLFLHADTALPHGAFDAMRSVLREAEIVGGNFALRFDERTTVARIFETIYRLRQRAFGTYFGDSAIFVRRAVYDACRHHVVATLPTPTDPHALDVDLDHDALPVRRRAGATSAFLPPERALTGAPTRIVIRRFGDFHVVESLERSDGSVPQRHIARKRSSAAARFESATLGDLATRS